MFVGVVATVLQPEGWSPWAAYLVAGLLLAGLALVGMLAWGGSLRAQVRRRTRDLEIAAAHQTFQAHLLSQVSDAIVVTDADGRVTTWNAGAEALFGRGAEDALGRALDEVIAQPPFAKREGDHRQAITLGIEWKGDVEVVRPSGETAFIEVALRPVTDDRGVLQGHLLLGHAYLHGARSGASAGREDNHR